MKINWNEIKDGAKGFEKLALEYVKDKFSNPTWKKTKETRDGNKDAIAYVFGYKSDNNPREQWWMEAKYSSKHENLTRYRLDSTIVSALLENNIKKVIFVTNIIIKSKTIMDIKTALINSTSCESVDFCSKYAIEHWLCSDLNRYKEFFYIKNNKAVISLDFNELYITQDIEYYEQTANKIAFVESSKELITNRTYVCHFSVYSPEKQIVSFKKSLKCKGIKVNKQNFTLIKGDNNLNFKITINENASINTNLVFYLGNREVHSCYPVKIVNINDAKLNIPTQSKTIDLIETLIKKFTKSQKSKYSIIAAECGSGKSHILKELSIKKALFSEDFYLTSFTTSDVENSRLIVNLILFLFFPYINPNEINEEYINNITSNIINSNLNQLVKLRNDYDSLINFFVQKSTFQDFFSSNLIINKRIIFIDDLQYLNEICLSFLIKIVSELQKKDVPIFILFTSDKELVQSNLFKKVTQNCEIEIIKYKLTLQELFKSIKNNIIDFDCYSKSFPNNINIIEFFAFTRFIFSDNDNINSIEDLFIRYRLFQSSEILATYVKKELINLFKTNPKCKKICDKIFSSHKPISIDELMASDIDIIQLIKCGFIKYDYYNNLTPTNEVYRKIYLNSFLIQESNILRSFDNDNAEYVRVCFENLTSPNKLKNICELIIDKYNKKKYSYILYTLDDIFESSDSRTLLESRINNKELFIKLYFSYAYAVHLQSSKNTARDYFTEIILKTKNSVNIELKKICINALWEMIISEYEYLNYKNSQKYINELVLMLKSLLPIYKDKKSILDFLKYHDAMTIKSQIESDLYGNGRRKLFSIRLDLSKKYHFEMRHYNTKIRVALSQIIYSPKECISIINSSANYFLTIEGDDSKMYIIGKFSYYFYKMVFERDLSLYEKVVYYHEKMKKDQYHNYRKRNFAMASFCYMMGDCETGNKYLFSEIYSTRKLAGRNYAFFKETIALYELKSNNINNSILELNIASEIFKELPSYCIVPKHNISVIEKYKYDIKRIAFWMGEVLEENTYYIDPRITW